MGLVLLGSLAANASAGSTNIVYRTDGVAGDVDFVHGEGDCTRTTGSFVVSTTETGEVVAGFFGVSTNVCGVLGPDGKPLSDGHFDFGYVTKKGSGLGVQTTSGSFTASVNDTEHFESLTFEFSLKFTGTGPTIVQRTHDVYNDPGALFYMTFDTSQHRAAKVTGTITVNGDAITLIDPFMGAGVSGGIYPTH